MSNNLQIAIEIVGLPRDGGHVTLDAFLTELRLLQLSMVRMDKLIDGEASAYYRIVSATHAPHPAHPTPLTIVLAPTSIVRKGRAPTEDRLVEFHHRYFQELTSIQNGQAPSNDVDDKTLALLDRIANGDGKTYTSLRIQNHDSSVEIDERFRKTISKLLTDQMTSFGSLTGTLDALNVHDERSSIIWIYPSTGPKRVSCKLPAKFKQDIKQATEKVVRVYGKKHFRANSLHPHRMDVEKFEVITNAPQQRLGNLRGIAKEGNADTDPVELINNTRDDWE